MNLAPMPQTVLMATDMSGRCDRALARAVQLSDHWKTRLLVVHALEADETGQAAERLRDDLIGQGITADVLIAPGQPAAVVLGAARRAQAGLVVTGLAQDQPELRRRVGTMADTLLGDPLDVPLLVVRERPTGPYRHVLVATDFSPASRAALETAAHWFPSASLTLFHAFEVSASDPTGLGFGEETRAESASLACEQMLAEMALASEVTERLHRVIEPGEPVALLPDFVGNSDVDLVVLGSNGRSRFMKKLLGSTTETLLHAIDGDVMVVRGGE